MNATAISVDRFSFDGRGPSLARAVWDTQYSARLVAIEYTNANSAELKHVRFFGVQVVMFTPEEVIGVSQMLESEREFHAAAMDYGKSEWLQSFDQQHLTRCHHYKLLFYDELLDVVCERVEFLDGPYRAEEAQS